MNEAAQSQQPSAIPEVEQHVLTGTLFRKRGRQVAFRDQPPPPKSARPPPAHVARMLALAHHLQGAIDRGLVPDRAAVARRLGLTWARITQLLDPLLLAPDLQVQALEMEAVDGLEPTSERALLEVVRAGSWVE